MSIIFGGGFGIVMKDKGVVSVLNMIFVFLFGGG